MKKIALLLAVLVCVSVLAPVLSGCNRYEGIDTSISGEISIMTWSGSSTYMEDIGHQTFAEDELGGGSSEAILYAVAKAFNEVYPNVKINVFCKAGSESDADGSWSQHRENFKAEHGHYPDVFWTKNLSEDMSRGLAADLSVFSNDPFFKEINPGLLSAYTYKGIIAGLPSFAEPWGVFVNVGLAEANNIDVPELNWTLDDYTDFVNSADNETFFGAMDAPYIDFSDVASEDMTKQLISRKDGEPYYSINTPDVKTVLSYVDDWGKSAVWQLQANGKISNEVMDEFWWWGHKFFYENKLLTNHYDPWMIGDPNLNNVENWDYYPFPALPGKENGIQTVLDGVVVYNYALDDGDPILSEEELAKMKLAYEFTKFYVADTRGFQSRLDTKFLNAETGDLVSSMNDSMPIVTGEEFDKQMEIWYASPTHSVLKDKPGYQKVVSIWESGKIYATMATPQSLTVEGELVWAMQKMWDLWNKDVVGVGYHEANWYDTILAKLPEYDTEINERFAEAEAQMAEALATYYGIEAE